MNDRLLIGVLGGHNSGKSHTWNELFQSGGDVRTGKHPRPLVLRQGECVEVFLVSGSPEERGKYIDDILGNQKARIVLCSMQYPNDKDDDLATLDHFIHRDFFIYAQWLNPGYENDADKIEDRLDLVGKILSAWSVCSVRDGKKDAASRVQEIREFIYGWAKYRDLVLPTAGT